MDKEDEKLIAELLAKGYVESDIRKAIEDGDAKALAEAGRYETYDE